MVWRGVYLAIFVLLVGLLHSAIGHYPAPLPQSPSPRREVVEALLLWGAALLFSALVTRAVSPRLERVFPDGTNRQLVLLPLYTLVWVVPFVLATRVKGWTPAEMGLTWAVRSREAVWFALAFGVISGIVAYASGRTVMGLKPLAAGELLLLVYCNAFVEEFYHRGVIQSLLERALGLMPAVWIGGLLFGLTHVVFSATMLGGQGGGAVISALALQTAGGWILAIIYAKTRSLWPGVACHYLVNWLPSILARLLGVR